MNDGEDLEQAALQRQLDDAFETTRPRVAFEDELWLRIQARRPIWSRLGDAISGLIGTIREAPSVPAGVAALVVIIAIGAGIISLSGLHPGGGAATSALRSTDETAGQQYGNGVPPQLGSVPAPTALQPGPSPGPKASGPELASSANLYFGPAQLVWSGTFAASAGGATLYRYQEPNPSTALQFATSLGAADTGHGQSGLGEYAGSGFVVAVRGSSRYPSAPPTYTLTNTATGHAAGQDAVILAGDFLSAHSLLPQWPFTIVAGHAGSETVVRYQRQFSLPSGGTPYLVDGSGSRVGLDVIVTADKVLTVSGPLPVDLVSAQYPVVTADQAVRAAIATSSTGPTVNLTSVELVYVLVVDGGYGYYEPAYLFSGTFPLSGTMYTKRVLVPAIAAGLRSQ
jgi:hypothetical protein